jgi:hypothetical protein
MPSQLKQYLDAQIAAGTPKGLTEAVVEVLAEGVSAARPKLVTVANSAARFALTAADVNIGDLVKQTDTRAVYTVLDTAELNNAAGYQEFVDTSDIPLTPTIVIDDNVIEFFGYPTTIAEGQFSTTGATAIQIGNSVTSIGNYALDNNALTEIIFPRSLTSLGPDVLSGNLLTSVTIPSSITSIGMYAFAYNPDLVNVNCYVTKPVIDAAMDVFQATSEDLVIHVRASDSTWTAGTGLTIGGNTSVNVVKDL